MYVKFTFTQEDSIEAAQRCLARSETVRSGRIKGMLSTAVTVGGIVFIILIKTDMPVAGLVIALCAAILSALFYPALSRSGTEQRLRKLHEEKLGKGGPFTCEVELTAVGLWVRQLSKQVTYEWESVEEIEETEDSIDIYTKDGGGVIVRKRAFTSPDQQKQFRELAEGYLELSRGDAEDASRLTD